MCLIINVYNYGMNLDIQKIYGLFCYGTIFNFMTIKNDIINKKIVHYNDYYNPTLIIHSFQSVEKEILKEMERAYGI